MVTFFDENTNVITEGTFCSGSSITLNVVFPGGSPGGYQFTYTDGFNNFDAPNGPFGGGAGLTLNPTATTPTTFNYSLVKSNRPVHAM